MHSSVAVPVAAVGIGEGPVPAPVSHLLSLPPAMAVYVPYSKCLCFCFSETRLPANQNTFCGNFNIHMCSSSKSRTDLTAMIDSYGYANIINTATRVTSHTSSTIYLFIARN